jgi:hypothetical protein
VHTDKTYSDTFWERLIAELQLPLAIETNQQTRMRHKNGLKVSQNVGAGITGLYCEIESGRARELVHRTLTTFCSQVFGGDWKTCATDPAQEPSEFLEAYEATRRASPPANQRRMGLWATLGNFAQLGKVSTYGRLIEADIPLFALDMSVHCELKAVIDVEGLLRLVAEFDGKPAEEDLAALWRITGHRFEKKGKLVPP